ncbi:Endoribonuclease Dicer [Aphanomyces cochlioides]|nr:Endoribonuclease Dicer [Aphanomyces cochlioides]
MAALRDYQEEVVKLAREQNVIMVGSTGIGKTFVSIMLLREQDYSTKRAFVLAPTRQLVHQIHSKILKLTTLKVEAYCGRELEVWDQMKWEHEILLNSVFVCTPEILRNLVTKGYITMARINLLIFDECHHVSKRHPYNQIMKLYNVLDKNMPRIFGTTACPTKDCGRNMHATVKQIKMKAKDLALYAACAPVIHETYEPNIDSHPTTAIRQVTQLLDEINLVEVYNALMAQGKYRHNFTAEKRGKRMTKLLDDCKTIYLSLGAWCMYRFIELEVEKQARSSSLRWTTVGSMVGLDSRAVDVLLRCADKRLQTQMACTPKVEKIVAILHDKFFGGRVPLVDVNDTRVSFDDDEYDEAAVGDDTIYIGTEGNSDSDNDNTSEGSELGESDDDIEFEPLPSLDEQAPTNYLLDKQLKCVIFVNRRAECRVLTDYLNARFVTKKPRADGDDESDEEESKQELFGCMLGQASAGDAAAYDTQDMHSLLNAFESGVVRVMVSTSVSCEGVDFPLCSMVVCADLISCPRKFIQVRGRARHSDGVCFYLTDIASTEHAQQLDVLARQAKEIGQLKFGGDKPVTLSQEPRSIAANFHRDDYTVTGVENGEWTDSSSCSLRVARTGAVLDLDSSISCLNMFIQSLPGYERLNLKPVYTFTEGSEDKKPVFKAILTLPSVLGMQPIETGYLKSKGASKALAAFHACESLFRQGKLDENFNSVYRRKKLRDVALANEIQAIHDRRNAKRLKT